MEQAEYGLVAGNTSTQENDSQLSDGMVNYECMIVFKILGISSDRMTNPSLVGTQLRNASNPVSHVDSSSATVSRRIDNLARDRTHFAG